MTTYSAFIAPFVDYGFMRRALVACLALGLGSAPIGVLLMLRRMSLVGDAMSHAILPGAAVGFLVAGGLSLPAMGLGGLIAGLSVALLSGLISRTTALREDASFATFYLTSLALGVLIVSLRGSNIDLLHVLFGTILAIDATALYLVGGIASFTLVTLALVYRPLVAECFDPGFLRAVAGRGSAYHFLFLFLVVLNLVAGFQALGHVDGRRLDDAARSSRAVVDAEPSGDVRHGGRHGRHFRLSRIGGIVPLRRGFGPRDHSHRQYHLRRVVAHFPVWSAAAAVPASALWCLIRSRP